MKQLPNCSHTWLCHFSGQRAGMMFARCSQAKFAGYGDFDFVGLGPVIYLLLGHSDLGLGLLLGPLAIEDRNRHSTGRCVCWAV